MSLRPSKDAAQLCIRVRYEKWQCLKAALPNVTVSLAKELANTGVTVNCVSPGILATDEVKAALVAASKRRGGSDRFEEIEAEMVARRFPNPCGRAGRIEEVGALVAFLASPLAGYINATNLRIDGGSADSAL